MSLKISVITVCLNSEKCIEKAILSVLAQDYQDIEYIVVDGQSTDGTLSILNQYKNRISKIISEKDGGIYDAMNKGVKAAQGDIIFFLNSDDAFYDNKILSVVAQKFSEDKNVDLIVGKLHLVNVSPKPGLNFKTPFVCKGFTKKDLLKYGMCQQRIFTRRGVFDRIGVFDQCYLICADFKWFLQCASWGVSWKNIDTIVAHYNHQGLSGRSVKLVVKEKLGIIFRNVSFFDFLYYFYYAILKKMITIKA